MSTYLQMGHDTENLVGGKDLDEYKGIILSPINREPGSLVSDIERFRKKGEYDIVFDPQLYFPRSLRGHLYKHPYYPSDIDTADLSSDSWWDTIVSSLSKFSQELKVNAVASPVICPKVWSDDYFTRCVDTSRILAESLDGTGVRVLTTVMVHVSQLIDELVLRIASIISGVDTSGYYIVLVNDVEPRREFSDPDELFGIMSLIKELEGTGKPLLMSHCSSDMLLFKAAGASHCATGKFFNLRRFTKSRYDEPAAGGGQLPYWFEHSLIAFLREADVLRLQKEGYGKLLCTLESGNYWSEPILENFKASPPSSWLALGWRQYLSWFGKTELLLAQHPELTREWLRTAEQNWRDLEDNDILFDEARNDGKWIRPWRQSLSRFMKEGNR